MLPLTTPGGISILLLGILISNFIIRNYFPNFIIRTSWYQEGHQDDDPDNVPLVIPGEFLILLLEIIIYIFIIFFLKKNKINLFFILDSGILGIPGRRITGYKTPV